MSELRPRRQYSVEAMPLTEEDREAVAEYVASELAAVPDPPSRAVREDAALRAALSAVAWRREVEAQCAVTRSVLESNARLAERVAELEGALKDLVLVNEEWNRATERIVGRPPGWSDAYLDRARRLLGMEVEP